MDSSKIEKPRVKIRMNLLISVLTVFLSASACMNVTKHSNIRTVDILAISGLGATIGVFIVNLVLLFKRKKQRNFTGTGY